MSILSRTVLFLIFTLCSLSAREVELHFQKYPVMRGNLEAIHSDHLIFKHSDFKKPVKFNLNRLKSIKLPPSENTQKKQSQVVSEITLVKRNKTSIPSDIIKGNLSSIKDGKITLTTPYAGELQLNKEFVQSLNIYDPSHQILIGPGNLKDWKISRYAKGITQNNNSILFKRVTAQAGQRHIYRKIDYPESFEVEVATEGFVNQKRFDINLFSNKTGGFGGNETSLRLSFTGYNLTIIKSSKEQRHQNRGSFNIPQKLKNLNGKSHFQFFLNRKTQLLSAYLNNTQIIEDLNVGELKQLGSHFSFAVRHYTPNFNLKKLNLTKWTGAKPNPLGSDKNEFKGDKGGPIKLTNGDLLWGTLTRITDGIALIDTKYGKFKVRLAHVSNLDLGKQQENQIKMEAGDIRVKFSNGSHFIMRLIAVKNGKIIGSSQSFLGEQEFDFSKVDAIEFENSLYQ